MNFIKKYSILYMKTLIQYIMEENIKKNNIYVITMGKVKSNGLLPKVGWNLWDENITKNAVLCPLRAFHWDTYENRVKILYCASGTFKIGDEIALFNDQTRAKIDPRWSYSVGDIIPCTKEAFDKWKKDHKEVISPNFYSVK